MTTQQTETTLSAQQETTTTIPNKQEPTTSSRDLTSQGITTTDTPILSSGQYSDGTYTGAQINAYYGWVQVKVQITDGIVASIDFLQYPNDRTTSQYINSQAMPLLRQEAIQIQSASVSGVSGATYTSNAFRESLSDALLQAKS